MKTPLTARTLSSVVALAALTACAVPFTSQKITPDPKKPQTADSIYYSLPRTEIIVSAKLLSITTKKPKCFALNEAVKAAPRKAAIDRATQTIENRPNDNPPRDNEPLVTAYTDAGLDIDDIPLTESIEFGQHDLTVTTRSRPDPKHVYAIELKGKTGHERKLAIELVVDGLIAGGQSSGENRGGEIAAKVIVDVLSAVATIAGSFFGSTTVAKAKALQDSRKGIKIELQQNSEFDVCYESLKRLTTLNNKRIEFIQGVGEPPVDVVGQLKILDDERARIERLFTGEKQIAKNGTVRCVIDPGDYDTGWTKSTNLWKFDKKKGVQIEDAAREKCVVSPEFGGTATEAAKTIALEVSTSETINSHAHAVQSSAKCRVPDDGECSNAVIYYRVPGRAEVSVLESDKTIYGPEPMVIAQFGPVLYLPAPTGNKKVEIAFKIDPTTGALIKVDAATGGDSASVPNIPEFGKAVGSLVTTVEDERNYSKSEQVKDKLVETCLKALKANEWSTACEEL